MSNIFLSTSFLYLANKEAGCLDENDEYIEGCENKVHGFRPASYLSNIALISGLLAAFFMPWIGAIIDHTSHRRTTGIIASTLMIVIQTAQIATIEQTWFFMSWLQAIAGFLYQVNILAVYAYLPEISRIVGQSKMNQRKTQTNNNRHAVTVFFIILKIFLTIFPSPSFCCSQRQHSHRHFKIYNDTIWIAIIILACCDCIAGNNKFPKCRGDGTDESGYQRFLDRNILLRILAVLFRGRPRKS